MYIKNPISNKDFIKTVLESYDMENDKYEAQRRKDQIENKQFDGISIYSEAIIGKQVTKRRNQDKYNTFIESVRAILLQECIFKVFKNAVPKIMQEDKSEVLARNMISSFINENGVVDIMRDMRSSSMINSSLYSLIESTVKKIREEVEIENIETLIIKPDIKDEFFDKLDMEDTEELSDMISQRVTAGINDFIKSNAEDREKIKEVLTNAKDKIEDVESNKDKDEETKEEISESLQMFAKRTITDIRNNKQNVFGSMVMEMSKSSMKNDALKAEFVTEGKLNVPKVINRVSLLYSFLETVNTMKLKKVDENYIEEVLDSLHA